ncbi:hypothetical protein [Staphylococcus delphini]|uniref:hypothetical protein n=1 Tax=Staphylococcus delphini TaxID=53344 RepID=UPI0023B26928|nr:hypothetical protein [Staphylococcus delphini]MDE9753172.1 hypothetical protein [Staphylococcus delphini]MDE9790390.1 hypothetical protein [Staphylococcus delphini]MDE9792470.1 hypothetical protein [Staphylococcus delphini]MDE9795183.1 hypothetical protein [Staphylococcus delphini]MDE9797290.1 hypothetical protein [Staphylococcus delphini]
MKRMERHNLNLLEQIETENRYFLKWDYYTDSFNNKDSHTVEFAEIEKLENGTYKLSIKYKLFYSPMEIKYIMYNYLEADTVPIETKEFEDFYSLRSWLKNEKYMLEMDSLNYKDRFLHLFDESERINRILINVVSALNVGLPYPFFYYENEKEVKDKLVHEVKKRYGDLCTYRIEKEYVYDEDYCITFY